MKPIDEQDKLLNSFFKSYRDNLPDNDFTKNIMNRLPIYESFISKKDIIIILILLLGTFLTMPNMYKIQSICHSLNPYTISFIIFCFVGIVLTIISATDSESELV